MPLRSGRSATERLVRRPSSAQPGPRKLAGSRKTIVLKDISQQNAEKGKAYSEKLLAKRGSRNLFDADEATLAHVMAVTKQVAAAAMTAFEADGIEVKQYNEAPAGQTVFHLHVHVVPRYLDRSPASHAGDTADHAELARQAARLADAMTFNQKD